MSYNLSPKHIRIDVIEVEVLMPSGNLTQSLKIKDWTGKEMNALDIFKLSIKCLKDHLMNVLKGQGRGVVEENIFWVLTVPATWNDAAKQFMREAAVRVSLNVFGMFVVFNYTLPRIIGVICLAQL
ncbi:hypothetical protein CHS0354_015829 [Potamilus streckersoni]|uniref:Uncharacterized protein n=1 Tax=Potamilus streckersoni TaxID=2493646 RepID=A0AAE0SE70_9BIVA|nr:hypothetical protein CHS0354_015829 [Potamilus streckersoni]